MMTATETRDTEVPDRDTSGEMAAPDRAGRGWLLAPVLAVLLLWTVPVAGLFTFAVALVLLAPLGRYVQDRFALANIFVLSAATAVFGVVKLPITLTTLQAMITVACVVLGVWGLIRPNDLRWPSFEPASFIFAGVSLLLLAVMALPFVGATPGQVLSGLMSGWDHSTHFSLFVGSYQQGVIEFLTDDGVPAMGVTYPSVPVWLWASATPAFVGTDAAAAQLLAPYVLFSAGAGAVSLGALTAAAADASGRLSISRRVGAAAGALVMGVLFLVGTATQFQDLGHVNYLMAVTVAVSGSWYAVAACLDGRRGLALVTIAAAGLVTVVMYPPVVMGTVIAGVWVLWRLFDSRPRLRWGFVAVGLAAIVLVLVVKRAAVSGVQGQIDALVPLTGGLQPFDVMVVVISPVVVAVLARIAYVRGVSVLLIGLCGAWAGLAAVSAFFAWRTLQLGVALADSYYTVKLILGVWVVASLLFAVLLALWFAGYLDPAAPGGRTFQGRWSSLAWLGLLVVVGASAGYVGPKPSGLPDGTPVAPGVTALLQREQLVGTLADGGVIVRASEVLNEAGSQPILWDGGDLKSNHYLMAMDGYVGNEERALVSTFPVPFGQEAATLLAQDLRAHPERRIQIAYRSPESRPVLRTLRREFPGQVTLVTLPEN